MLVGTEALREAISGLQDRVHVTAKSAHLADAVIDENDSDIEDKEQGIKERKRESKMASKQGKGGVLASKVLTTTKVGKLVS